jgi:hypothetical protein
MAQLLCSHLHPFIPQFLNGPGQFQDIPEDDSRHNQVEPLGALLLLSMRTILHSPLPIEKDGSCQRVACLSLVQTDLYPPTQFKTLEPLKGKQRLLDASHLTQRPGQPVLARIGGQFAQHE